MIDLTTKFSIRNELKRVGEYSLKECKPYSSYPEDSYLIDILAYNYNKDTYVTWLYNNSTKTLQHGHYDFKTYDRAYEDFMKRGLQNNIEEYTIDIVEELRRSVTVSANSREQAEEIVLKMYRDGEVILGAEDFTRYEIYPQKLEEKQVDFEKIYKVEIEKNSFIRESTGDLFCKYNLINAQSGEQVVSAYMLIETKTAYGQPYGAVAEQEIREKLRDGILLKELCDYSEMPAGMQLLMRDYLEAEDFMYYVDTDRRNEYTNEVLKEIEEYVDKSVFKDYIEVCQNPKDAEPLITVYMSAINHINFISLEEEQELAYLSRTSNDGISVNDIAADDVDFPKFELHDNKAVTNKNNETMKNTEQEL